MAGISTHVLDLTSGRPAAGVAVTLDRRGPSDTWTEVARATTDPDGRIRDLAGAGGAIPGVYRIRFATGRHYQATATRTFYPEVSVIFQIDDDTRHHHVPLLLGPFGYSTYLGS